MLRQNKGQKGHLASETENVYDRRPGKYLMSLPNFFTGAATVTIVVMRWVYT